MTESVFWLSARDIAHLTGVPLRTVQRRAKADGWPRWRRHQVWVYDYDAACRSLGR